MRICETSLFTPLCVVLPSETIRTPYIMMMMWPFHFVEGVDRYHLKYVDSRKFSLVLLKPMGRFALLRAMLRMSKRQLGMVSTTSDLKVDIFEKIL